MIKETDRVRDIVGILRKIYPASRTALAYKTPIQLLVATILSAQCTDVRVNKVTPGLFKKYKSVEDFAIARRSVLEQEIRSTGFYRHKAKNIIAASKKIVDEFGSKVPDNMKDLTSLAGVARKTANIVLSSVFKKAQGIAVDTHVNRLSQRLGLSKQGNSEKIELDLLNVVPREYWLEFNYLLVNHGRAICKARNPMCPQCAINRLCPSAKKFFPDLNFK